MIEYKNIVLNGKIIYNVCRKHGSPELPSTTPQRAGETEDDQENGGRNNKPEQALCLIPEVVDDDDFLYLTDLFYFLEISLQARIVKK